MASAGRPIAIALVLVAAGAVGWTALTGLSPQSPPGIEAANGRVEGIEVHVAAKFAGRITGIRADEGDLVHAGDILVTLDRRTLEAQRNAAIAQVALRREERAAAEAALAGRERQLSLAQVTLKRTRELARRGNISDATVDADTTREAVATAELAAARAQLNQADAAVQAALAQVEEIESTLADTVIYAPIDGRVQYRTAEPGEVVAAGARLLTLVDLRSLYMQVYVPMGTAGQVRLGDEARVRIDALPGAVIPARVSFVAPEAEFTPKEVETREERQNLVFRVKLDLPETADERVKPGMPGTGYVRTVPDAVWPETLP